MAHNDYDQEEPEFCADCGWEFTMAEMAHSSYYRLDDELLCEECFFKAMLEDVDRLESYAKENKEKFLEHCKKECCA